MSRKRRIFDINLPEDDLPDATPSAPQPTVRRGPMASAIAENADALQARQSATEAIRAENDALAHEFVAAQKSGQVITLVALGDIHTDLLVRDRLPGDDDELADLITSLRDVGLSNPIRVTQRAQGDGYELVQGQRRLTAFRHLHDETGADEWAAIPALLVTDGQGIDTLYRRMVDENIVRKDLSYVEMAEAARNFAMDPDTPVHSTEEAVKVLFKSASYAKRSHIRAFARLFDLIGDALNFPAEIPRNLGLALVRMLEDHPARIETIKRDLKDWDNRSIADELGVLRDVARADELADLTPAPKARKADAATDPKQAKTTFDLRTTRGRVKCTAGVGRLEIKTDRDFTAIDRARLESAITALIDGLG